MSESKVKIYQPKNCNGYFIHIEDEHSESQLAITREELEKIVLCGQIILKEK